MPVLEADTTKIKQECLTCGGIHTIPLRHGYSKSRREPYSLVDGDTLELKVDDAVSPQIVPFSAADFASIAVALASEVVAKINAVIVGATASVEERAVRIVSASSLPGVTSIEIIGGSARAKLGFDGRRCGALVLGTTKGSGTSKLTAVNTIDLPHCPGCGSKECLIRTWDETPFAATGELHATHRGVVNALAQHLKQLGHSDPDAKAAHDAETRQPPELASTFALGRVELTSARVGSGAATARRPP